MNVSKAGLRISVALHQYASRAETRGVGGGPSVVEYFQEYFGRPCLLLPNGRTAIALLLESLGVTKDDEVYITTTFEKPNVSSHVTATIFNYCRPSRVLTDKTRSILVIHEFGVPHPGTRQLLATARERGIPLIEDCAHTVDSWLNGQRVGTLGDYAIVSFPKIFPVRYGGLLVGEKVGYQPTRIQRDRMAEVERQLPGYLPFLPQYTERKRVHFRFLESRFAELLLQPLFTLTDGISPSFHFPLVTARWEEVLEAAWAAGIEAARWHGADIVVLPQHQFLVDEELEYIVEVVRSVVRSERQ